MTVSEEKIYNCPELIDYIEKTGVLPLLDMGIDNWSAEAVTDETCHYIVLSDGGWEWPLWEWKGSILRESGCAYGKFIKRKATFISKELWPDFCNYRRSLFPYPEEGSVEEIILSVLHDSGSLITRELRNACGFNGAKMRGKFDAYITRLQMMCYIVTEDFVYPTDAYGKRYGWGWSLLTTPELRFGKDACHPPRTAEESFERLLRHFKSILPNRSESSITRLLSTGSQRRLPDQT